MTGVTIAQSTYTLPSLGFDVRVLTAGDGPVVLMLHGNPDCADEWRLVMERLGDRFRCIAPDFPGYGASPRPPRSFAYDLPAQIAFVNAVLDVLKVSDPILLVVHDVGGFVGIPWADANLKRLQGLLILNTVAFEGFEWFTLAKRFGARSFVGRTLAQLLMFGMGLGGGARFRKIFASQSPQLPPEQIERFTRSFALNANAKDATLRQFRHATRPDFFDGFDAMNQRITAAVPTRVLWGEGDVYVGDASATRFADAPVTVLPGVGHWVPLVAADRVAEAVTALARAERPTPSPAR